MEHYFISKEHKQSDYFEFLETINNQNFTFKSCDDIFSKDRVDYGTKVLINAVIKNFDLYGKVLDIGCGYGPIGIVLASFNKNAEFILTDVNKTAVELSTHNAKTNNIKNIEDIRLSDTYEIINETFDFIISNPPIKAGKQTLLNILLGAYEHLKNEGKLIFVIKKKHGEDSIKKRLEQVFKSVEIIKRDSGYYILSCTKWEKK